MLKKIAKDAKKFGYEFDKDELGQALDEINQQGAFLDVEVDAADLYAMVGQGAMQACKAESLHDADNP